MWPICDGAQQVTANPLRGMLPIHNLWIYVGTPCVWLPLYMRFLVGLVWRVIDWNPRTWRSGNMRGFWFGTCGCCLWILISLTRHRTLFWSFFARFTTLTLDSIVLYYSNHVSSFELRKTHIWLFTMYLWVTRQWFVFNIKRHTKTKKKITHRSSLRNDIERKVFNI